MSCLIGVLLALTVAGLAALAGFDRERGFYPTLAMVIASYYVLFAVSGAGRAIIGGETAVMLLFCAAATIGFRHNLWIVVAVLAGHGLFDSVHDRIMLNPGKPDWWRAFCAGFDLTFALCLAAAIRRARHGGQTRGFLAARLP